MARVVLGEDHEELAAARVLASVRHREGADLVLPRIAGGLALDLPSGTTGADARIALGKVLRQWVATLDDEVRNDAVELHPIVEAGVGELLEVLDGLGGILLVE